MPRTTIMSAKTHGLLGVQEFLGSHIEFNLIRQDNRLFVDTKDFAALLEHMAQSSIIDHKSEAIQGVAQLLRDLSHES